MLAAFLFDHRWRCTLDWEVTGVSEDRVCLLTGQKRLEDDYKEPDVLPKVKRLIQQGQWSPPMSISDHVMVL